MKKQKTLYHIRDISKTIILFLLCFFLCVDLPVPTSATDIHYGDANGDGDISAADARIILRVAVGLHTSGEYAIEMDVDGDAVISAADARLVLRYAVGLENYFPVELPFSPPEEVQSFSTHIGTHSALLYNMNTNMLLYQKDIDEKTAPASLIKLLTALTALKYCDPDQEFIVGEEIELIGEESSLCLLQKGMRLTLHQLLYGMCLPSGNDAAYCIAANVAHILKKNLTAEQAIQYYVNLMNCEAKKLGMTNTVIMTPDGYDQEGQFTTTRDLLVLSRAALQNDLIVEVCSTFRKRITLTDGRFYIWENTNRFLNPSDRYYDSRVNGLKGGYTDDAGCCLITSFKQAGNTYIIIVMGADQFSERYEFTSKLMDQIVSEYKQSQV